MEKNNQELFKVDNDFYNVKFEESEKVKLYKLKKRYVRFFSFLVFLLSIVLLYFIFFSSFADIRNIYIENERLVSEEEILELSGLKEYPNYYFTLKSSIHSKLITHKLIKDVKVTKSKKTVYLDIVETKPLLKVDTGEYLFDNNLIFNHDFVDVVPFYHGDLALLENVDFLKEINQLYNDSYENFSRISEFIYEPSGLNHRQLKFIMRDGNTVIVTYDDFAYKMSFYVDILININDRMPDTRGIIDLVATIDCNEQCNYEFKPY